MAQSFLVILAAGFWVWLLFREERQFRIWIFYFPFYYSYIKKKQMQYFCESYLIIYKKNILDFIVYKNYIFFMQKIIIIKGREIGNMVAKLSSSRAIRIILNSVGILFYFFMNWVARMKPIIAYSIPYSLCSKEQIDPD